MKNIGDELLALAKKADAAIANPNANKEQIGQLIKTANSHATKSYPNTARAYVHHILSNLHRKLSSISKENPSGWRSNNYPINLTAAINHIRTASNLVGNDANAFTNTIRVSLAITLSCQGREVEIMNNWTCDFSTLSEAPFLSSLSKGHALARIANLLNDENHRLFYKYEALLLFEKLADNIASIDNPHVTDALKNDPLIQDYLENKDLFAPLSGWSTKDTPEVYNLISIAWARLRAPNGEKAYRLWCLKNRLFANPLNDITTKWIAAKDSLQFPDHECKGHFPVSSFSALKREYCFARFMAYEGIHNIHPKFENKKLCLSNTSDCPDYSGASEKLKTGFRICFSVLDSIAYLMNNYFDCKSERIAFTPNWIKDNFKNLDDNPYIDALYWLSCDLFDNKEVASDPEKWKAPDPESPEIRPLRNAIEHGWLRVAKVESDIGGKDNRYAHVITSKKLAEQTIFVIKLVRSAMLYLTLAIKYHKISKSAGEK